VPHEEHKGFIKHLLMETPSIVLTTLAKHGHATKNDVLCSPPGMGG